MTTIYLLMGEDARRQYHEGGLSAVKDAEIDVTAIEYNPAQSIEDLVGEVLAKVDGCLSSTLITKEEYEELASYSASKNEEEIERDKQFAEIKKNSIPVTFTHNGEKHTHRLVIDPPTETDYWEGFESHGKSYDVHYCEDYNEICVYEYDTAKQQSLTQTTLHTQPIIK